MVFSFGLKCVKNLNYQDKSRYQKLCLRCTPHLNEAGESKMLLSEIGLANGLKLCER